MTSSSTDSRLIALIVACAMFMAQLDGAIVALALPDIGRSFGVAPIDLTLGISLYLLMQVIFLPTGSWISDRFGARRVFALAMVGFTIASVLCALSQTVPQFIAARVLQGGAAALMTPVGRIVLLSVTEKADLIRVMTISTVPMLVAPTIGPVIGGFLTTYWSWQWIFLLNVPIGIAGVLLTLRYIPVRHDNRRRPFDALGFALFVAACVLLIGALEQFGAAGRAWHWPALAAGVGLVLGWLAFRHARRHPHPIVSLAAMSIPTYLIATVRGGALIRLPVRSLPFILPMMFQLALGLNAFQAGVLLLGLSAGDLLLKVITTRTLRHFGFRSSIVSSALLCAATIALCATFSAATPLAYIFGVLLLSGMFRSVLFTAVSTLAMADVPREEISSASTLWNLFQQGTNVLGVSLSVILLALSAQFAGGTPDAPSLLDFRLTLLVMAALAFASVLSFRRLAPDAGAAVSGHRPPDRTPDDQGPPSRSA